MGTRVCAVVRNSWAERNSATSAGGHSKPGPHRAIFEAFAPQPGRGKPDRIHVVNNSYSTTPSTTYQTRIVMYVAPAAMSLILRIRSSRSGCT